MSKVSLSPCVISWAKYALGIKNIKPQNSKKCSVDYWIRVVDDLIKLHPSFFSYRENAIDKYYLVKR
jgi:hypothetical protein